jgi:hypothetical protein
MVALGTTVFGSEGQTFADDRDCASVRVFERAALPVAWHEAVETLRGDLMHLDGQSCAGMVGSTLVVGSAPGGVSVLATTADGAHVERIVSTPSSLSAVAFGLLATIPTEPPPIGPSSAPSTLSVTANPPPVEPRAPAPAGGARNFAFRVAPSVGGRFGFPTPVLMGDLVGRIELRVRDWLIIGSARYGAIAEHGGGAPIAGWFYEEAGFGLGIGRRLQLGELTCDVAVVPQLVIVNEEADVPVEGTGGSADEFRVEGLLRAIVPVGGQVRPALMVDAELTPLKLGSPTSLAPSLPPLPTWTLGMGVGIVWEVP